VLLVSFAELTTAQLELSLGRTPRELSQQSVAGASTVVVAREADGEPLAVEEHLAGGIADHPGPRVNRTGSHRDGRRTEEPQGQLD
jgi:hypothetical protein